MVFRDQSLNQEQKAAVKFALDSKTINLIHGPPGTGKTKTLCEFIYQAAREKNLKVLACAASNIAVDNMVERLDGHVKLCRVGHPARMLPSVVKNSMDSLIFRSSHAKLVRKIYKNKTSLRGVPSSKLNNFETDLNSNYRLN